MKAGSLKAINREDVSRICSSQVVVQLHVAVKELVENSIVSLYYLPSVAQPLRHARRMRVQKL